MKVAIRSLARLHFLLIVFGAVTFVSCGGNKSNLSSHIPKESTVVFKFDVKSMALKSLSFKDMFTMDNLKKVMGKSGDNKDSPGSAGNPGIDLTSDAYIFGIVTPAEKYGALLAKLSDAAQFEAFLKASDNSVTITDDADLHMKIASISGGIGLIAFDDKNIYAVFGDSAVSVDKIKSIVTLKEEESLAAVNESFKSLQKESGDISFWVSFADVMKMVPQYSAAMNQSNFTDTYATAVCNFEDGQVVVNGKYTTNAEMAEKSKMMKGSVSKSAAKTLPGQSVIGLMGFAMDMEKIYGELEKQGSIAQVNPSAMQFTGMSVKEIMNMLSGDFAASLNGLTSKEVQVKNPYTGENMTSRQTEADYTAVIGIADKAKLHGFLEKIAGGGLLTKSDKFYSFQNKTFVGERDDMLIITSTEARLRSALDGSGAALSNELSDLLTSNAYAMEFNPTNIPDELFTDKNLLHNIKTSEIVEFEVTATSMTDKTSTAKFVMKFKEKGENALVTITRVAKEFKSMTSPKPVPADTTAVPSM